MTGTFLFSLHHPDGATRLGDGEEFHAISLTRNKIRGMMNENGASFFFLSSKQKGKYAEDEEEKKSCWICKLGRQQDPSRRDIQMDGM